MKTALVTILLMFPIVSAAQDRDQPLIANERALQEAVGKIDKSAFGSLVASDGVWTTPVMEGFVPIAFLTNDLEQFRLTRWSVENPRVWWLGDDSAVVLSTWSATGTYGDRAVTPLTLSCTVWTKRNGKWIAVIHQESELHSRSGG